MSDAPGGKLGEIAGSIASADFIGTLQHKVNQIYQLYSEKSLEVLIFEPLSSEFGERFYRFARPDPESAAEAKRGLDEAKTALARNRDTMMAIRGDVMNWIGDAADNFRNYVTETSEAIKVQEDALTALSKIQEAQEALVAASRLDILSIADGTIAALQAFERDRSTDWGKVMLGAAVAIGGVLAAPVTAGTSLAITGAVVSALAGGASTMAGARETTISGAHPVETIDSAGQAITDLEMVVDNEREKIVKAINAAGTGMQERTTSQSGESKLAILPPVPTIARGGGYDPDEFALPESMPIV